MNLCTIWTIIWKLGWLDKDIYVLIKTSIYIYIYMYCQYIAIQMKLTCFKIGVALWATVANEIPCLPLYLLEVETCILGFGPFGYGNIKEKEYLATCRDV